MKKALFLHLKVIGILSILIFSNCVMKTEPETYLIPSDFRGRVNIIYDQKCGMETEFENDRRVYRIPDDGILLTKFKTPSGLIDHKYFLVDNNGNRTELTKMDVRDYNEEYTNTKNPNEPPRDTLGIFGWGGLGNMIGTGYTESVSFQSFSVSTYDSLNNFKGRKSMDFDNLIQKKITDCK
ncbi:DUF6843 domain-containing protein [Maribacter sp. 2210JD10-5]|uniref:DUF6843 domain-containing protein n=1 Tax=Maribacter sp. 2210JD10-5 TaxID=3386272 RepID=UPI0039BD813C